MTRGTSGHSPISSGRLEGTLLIIDASTKNERPCLGRRLSVVYAAASVPPATLRGMHAAFTVPTPVALAVVGHGTRRE